jgi:hypothetical protein
MAKDTPLTGADSLSQEKDVVYLYPTGLRAVTGIASSYDDVYPEELRGAVRKQRRRVPPVCSLPAAIVFTALQATTSQSTDQPNARIIPAPEHTLSPTHHPPTL